MSTHTVALVHILDRPCPRDAQSAAADNHRVVVRSVRWAALPVVDTFRKRWLVECGHELCAGWDDLVAGETGAVVDGGGWPWLEMALCFGAALPFRGFPGGDDLSHLRNFLLALFARTVYSWPCDIPYEASRRWFASSESRGASCILYP
jgi:hypothetical protein